MTPIERARQYIRTQVQDPALHHPTLPLAIRQKVKNSNVWLDRFERVGDLIVYLKRFELGTNDPTYQVLHAHGLATFEDIAHTFENEFSLWANDCTRPTDFIIGNRYSAHQILIFARSYDTRSGGMFVLESGNRPSTVIIKATLSGGRYANQWLDEPNGLKYYLKSIGNSFGEHFKPNAAILENHQIPIMTFVRVSEDAPFIYQGVFKYEAIHREGDGSKWFELVRDRDQVESVEDAAFRQKVFAEETRVARQSPREQRLARLASASKKPQPTLVLATDYRRNPDVVAEVLHRARGHCEGCRRPAPFKRRADDTPYLEVHHRIPLAQGGDDAVENAIALCPNCHREAHFG